MSVTDRWHKSYPKPGDEPCKHGKADAPLYPSKEHLKGDRWQVRWYDPDGKQRSRNFRLKDGKDPNKHADAFDKKIQAELASDDYIDPKAAETTFAEYAAERFEARKVEANRKRALLGFLYNHVNEDPDNPGRTRCGGPSLGQYTFANLGRKISLTRDWVDGLDYMEDSSAAQVVAAMSMVFRAAIDDNLIRRNPTLADSVDRPKAETVKAEPWSPDVVDAVAEGLEKQDARCGILPFLGAATGMRQGEMFGFSADDIGEADFFRKQLIVQVRRQVQVKGGVLCFAKLKNKKDHAAPVPAAFAEMLLEYMERFPPVEVTLPWEKPDGKPVTHRLIIVRDDGRPWTAQYFNQYRWKPALAHARLIPPRPRGGEWPAARDKGCHRLRHTAVSWWLGKGASLSDVAAWIGDTEAEVLKTYSHMIPGAEAKGRAAMAEFFALLPSGARNMHSRGPSEGSGLVSDVPAISSPETSPDSSARRQEP